jgi:peptidoglycan/xylan/chitin deacetylase (PgdA/CDA1 family)
MAVVRDLAGYGRLRPDLKWPNGARLAVSLVLNFEEGGELAIEAGDGETERFGEVASVQPPGVRDLVQEQVFSFGMRVGLWRLLDAFDRYALPLTLMMCGRAVERVPELARAAVARGHEPAMHGWRWLPNSRFTDRQAEREDLLRTRDVIAAATGVVPVGFMCRGGQSPWTRDLVSELGLLYDSNGLDDELPYWDRHARPRPVLVLPYGFDTNDMKFFNPNGFVRPSDFSDYVGCALDTLMAEAERGSSAMLTIGLHLRICGRPARFAAVETILSRLARWGDRLWVARRREIAEHFFNTYGPPTEPNMS